MPRISLPDILLSTNHGRSVEDTRPTTANDHVTESSFQMTGIDDVECSETRTYVWTRKLGQQACTRTTSRFRHRCQYVRDDGDDDDSCAPASKIVKTMYKPETLCMRWLFMGHLYRMTKLKKIEEAKHACRSRQANHQPTDGDLSELSQASVLQTVEDISQVASPVDIDGVDWPSTANNSSWFYITGMSNSEHVSVQDVVASVEEQTTDENQIQVADGCEATGPMKHIDRHAIDEGGNVDYSATGNETVPVGIPQSCKRTKNSNDTVIHTSADGSTAGNGEDLLNKHLTGMGEASEKPGGQDADMPSKSHTSGLTESIGYIQEVKLTKMERISAKELISCTRDSNGDDTLVETHHQKPSSPLSNHVPRTSQIDSNQEQLATGVKTMPSAKGDLSTDCEIAFAASDHGNQSDVGGMNNTEASVGNDALSDDGRRHGKKRDKFLIRRNRSFFKDFSRKLSSMRNRVDSKLKEIDSNNKQSSD